jgi:osmotically-inducible protein OsmY
VATDADKTQAESIAKSLAGTQVVANQIAVITAGAESAAKDMNSDLDKGIESNLDAALIKAKLHTNVKFSVKNHVVTLTGVVHSQANRARAEQVAAGVPNVQQVVNELQVRDQKATSGN